MPAILENISNTVSAQYSRASRYVSDLIERVKMTEHLYMIILAIIIGILAGFGAVGIRWLIHEISSISFTGDGTILENIQNTPWYWILIVPAIGGLIVGPLIYKFAPEAKGHGVPEVMQAVLLKGGFIRPRVAAIKAFASAVTIGTGGSVGREGPIIQIGASLGSTVGQFFQVNSKRMKTLVGCGAAAGIAAAFNAPVAGALFAVEIILMDFAVAQFSPIVIASVMATVISHSFEGDFAAFAVPQYTLVSPIEISFYFILGLLAGAVSFLFIKILYYFEDFWDDKIKIHPMFKPAIGGLMIGAIGIVMPHTMGVGYDGINMALTSTMVWDLALILIFIKILSTSITLGSGGSGGIFAPSLFMGAMLGSFFGSFVHSVFPEITAEPGAYALVAMGGLVAGTTRAPITAIIIVFELTKEYEIILPLMITSILAMILSQKFNRESIYTLKLLNRNIKINERAEINVMKSICVKDCYRMRYEVIPENMNFADIVHTLITKRLPYVFVHDMHDKFMGMISIHDIKDHIFEKDSLRWVLIAGDLADKDITKVLPSDDCKSVLEKLSGTDYDALPVVSPDDPYKQIGVVWRRDIDEAYRKEIEHIELTSDLANKIAAQNADEDQSIHFMEGYVISEVNVPKEFIGKTIRDLGIRSKYGVDILTIKNYTKGGRAIKAIPQADYTFKIDDKLVIAGKAEEISKLKLIK